ncbi:MAG: hypothetical protein ACOY33_05815 [Pseudomonadota bacterium]
MLAREWTETPDQFLFSDSLFDVRDVVLVPAAAPARRPDDLFGMQLGTRHGYTYPELAAHFDAGRLRPVHALGAVGYRFAFARPDAERVAIFNRELAAMKRDGTLNRILASYRN